MGKQQGDVTKKHQACVQAFAEEISLHDAVGPCSGYTVLFDIKVIFNITYCRAALLPYF